MVRRPTDIPDTPGAYLFRDSAGAVLYVGKAKSLRKRVANYFTTGLSPRTRSMVEAADSVEWIVTDSDVAAIMLEYSLIQKHRPRFNIRLKDDKSFPYLAITRNQEWPRASVMRGKRRKGTQYFGPYAQAYAIRQTLDLLIRTFPVRTCTDAKFGRHQAMGKPCLLFHIERCSGPCVGEVTPEEYQGHVDAMADFLDGNSDDIVERLGLEMLAAADAQEYEVAARRRDQMTAVERALARQEVVSKRKEDFDLIAIEADDLEAALVVLHIKKGRVVGRVATVVDRVEEVSEEQLIGVMLRQLYGDEPPPPRILVQQMPDEPETWQAWLALRRGSAVSLSVPQRGTKRRLMETAQVNAREVFSRHRLKRHRDHNSRAKALRSLQQHLSMDVPPLRIECYDISTIQGSDTVASMVVFEDGAPAKRESPACFLQRAMAARAELSPSAARPDFTREKASSRCTSPVRTSSSPYRKADARRAHCGNIRVRARDHLAQGTRAPLPLWDLPRLGHEPADRAPPPGG